MIAERLRAHRAAASLAAAFALVLIASSVFSSNGVVPVGVYGVGVVGGSLIALHAVGLVLVYRAERIINFSQIQMSALAGSLFAGLVQRRLLLVGLHAICPPCLRPPRTIGELRASGSYGLDVLRSSGVGDLPGQTPLSTVTDAFGGKLDAGRLAAAGAPGWLLHLQYWLAFVLAIAAAALLVWGLYVLVIKRFHRAPRLILTVLTLGAGHAAYTIGSVPLRALLAAGGGAADASRPPGDLTVTVAPAVFSLIDVITVILAAGFIAAIGLFLRRSSSGLVLRAAAENPERAQTLGVGVTGVAARAWVLAGIAGGVAAVLTTASVGPSAALQGGELVQTIAAAVAGGLVSIPIAVAAALGIGVVEQAVRWATGATVLVSLLLLAIVLGILLIQRARQSRADIESASTWQATREIRPIPSELRSHRTVRSALVSLAVTAGVVCVGYPWFMSPGQTALAMTTMVYAIIGLSLLVLTGWAGHVSLGQVAFAAIGGWIAAATGVPFPIALVLGGFAGAVFAVAVGVPALRLRGLHLAVTTLALAGAVSALLLDRHALGRFVRDDVERPVLLGLNLDDDRAFYYVVLAILAAAVASTTGMRRHRTARALIACRDNDRAAASFGIDLVRGRLGAFAISGAMAAVAGVVLVTVQRGFQPQSFSADRSIEAFLVTIVGGLGSIAGPIVGALYIGALGLLRSTPLGALAGVLLSPGIGVVVLFLFAPGGIVRLLADARDAWLRRVASRYRIVVPSLLADTGADHDRRVTLASPEPAAVPVRYRPARAWRAGAATGGDRT